MDQTKEGCNQNIGYASLTVDTLHARGYAPIEWEERDIDVRYQCLLNGHASCVDTG